MLVIFSTSYAINSKQTMSNLMYSKISKNLSTSKLTYRLSFDQPQSLLIDSLLRNKISIKTKQLNNFYCYENKNQGLKLHIITNHGFNVSYHNFLQLA